jgi:hypothetical protein
VLCRTLARVVCFAGTICKCLALGVSIQTICSHAHSASAVCVYAQRHPDFYITNLIFPTIAVTYLGTIQFLIPPDGASVDRMGLPASLLLTLIAIIFLVSEDAPKTAEPTNLSRFNFGNLLWLGASMLETSFVLFVSKQKAYVHAPAMRTMMDMLNNEERGVHSVFLDIFSLSLWSKGFKSLYLVYARGVKPEDERVTMLEMGNVLDMFCRVIYPAAYTVFIATVFTSNQAGD